MGKLYDLLNTLIGKVNAAVRTDAQILTEDQKAQARQNIGAVSVSEVTSQIESAIGVAIAASY